MKAVDEGRGGGEGDLVKVERDTSFGEGVAEVEGEGDTEGERKRLMRDREKACFDERKCQSWSSLCSRQNVRKYDVR